MSIKTCSELALTALVSFSTFACVVRTDDGSSEKGSEPVTEFWSDSSDAIDIEYWESFGGTIRYRKTREQLTAEELALLGDIQVIEQNSTCIFDGASASLSVTA